jgi:hypothetical protein
MISVRLDAREIRDAPALHDALSAALGLPAYYGRNLNALRDCLADPSAPGHQGLTAVRLDEDHLLALEIIDAVGLAWRLPELLLALVDTVARVNREKQERGAPHRVLIVPR